MATMATPSTFAGLPVYYNDWMEPGHVVVSRTALMNPRGEPIVIYARDAATVHALADKLNEMLSMEKCFDYLEMHMMGIDLG
jgi:hypothetical protein